MITISHTLSEGVGYLNARISSATQDANSAERRTKSDQVVYKYNNIDLLRLPYIMNYALVKNTSHIRIQSLKRPEKLGNRYGSFKITELITQSAQPSTNRFSRVFTEYIISHIVHVYCTY